MDSKKLATCPICGYPGDDMLVKFYCTNDKCQNYDASTLERVTAEAKKTPSHTVSYPPFYDDLYDLFAS